MKIALTELFKENAWNVSEELAERILTETSLDASRLAIEPVAAAQIEEMLAGLSAIPIEKITIRKAVILVIQAAVNKLKPVEMIRFLPRLPLVELNRPTPPTAKQTPVSQRALVSRFAGYLNYTPYMPLDRDLQRKLARLMVKQGLVEEPENPTIVMDWVFADQPRQENSLYQRSRVVMYLDGGDGEEPACVFYRVDDFNGQPSVKYIHFPPAEIQPELTQRMNWLMDCDTEKIDYLGRYIASVINDDAQWVKLVEPKEGEIVL